MSKSKEEVLRRKSLGELGELFAIKALVDNGYEKIRNLNDTEMNYPFADLYAEKGRVRVVISVKARNKFQKNNKLNGHYNLGANAYKNSARAERKYKAKAYWMAIQFDQFTCSVYLGELKELNGKMSIPLRQCESGVVGKCLVRDKKHHFDFGYFGIKKASSLG